MGEKLKEKLKNRYLILALLFAAFVVIVTFRLAALQIAMGEKYREDSLTKNLNVRRVPAQRGNIMDTNGIPIAVSRMGITVQMVRTGLDSLSLNDVCYKLVEIFEKNKDSYEKSFKQYLTYDPIDFGPMLGSASDKAASASQRKSLTVIPEEEVLRNNLEEYNSQDRDVYAFKSFDDSEKPVSRYMPLDPVNYTPVVVESSITRAAEFFGIKKDAAGKMKDARDLFNYLRKDVYLIDEKYTDEQAYKIMTIRFEIRNYGVANPVVLAKDVSKRTWAEVEERHRELPGVTTDVEPLRKYIEANYAAHIIGYVRGISADQYEDLKDDGYRMTDIIGYTGVEKAAEKYLRGQDGKRRIEVDTFGRLTTELGSTPAVPGDNIVLTLDMNLQKVASESLERTVNDIRNKKPGKYDSKKWNKGDADSGAVVAIDVNSGEILAMASYPTYDPAVFLEGADNKEAQDAISFMFQDQSKPAFHRAIAGNYAPGSTFKPLVSVAALEEKVITERESIPDPGHIEIDGWPLYCMEGGHGYIGMTEAIATSCNVYFYQVGVRLTGDNIDRWAKMFGLGEKTGIDLSPGEESSGQRSNADFKSTLTGAGAWGRLDSALTAIGQRYNSFTPLQLANYTAALANGGKLYTPHLIKMRENYDGSKVYETKKKFTQIPVSKETLKAVKKGMIEVANSSEGTAAKVFADFTRKYGITVAGKTGTAETTASTVLNNPSSNNGVFISYAPADDPKIAVAVIIEKGVYGFYAADVAKDIMTEYFDASNRKVVDEEAKPDEARLIP